jgi:hypothetical protein
MHSVSMIWSNRVSMSFTPALIIALLYENIISAILLEIIAEKVRTGFGLLTKSLVSFTRRVVIMVAKVMSAKNEKESLANANRLFSPLA